MKAAAALLVAAIVAAWLAPATTELSVRLELGDFAGVAVAFKTPAGGWLVEVDWSRSRPAPRPAWDITAGAELPATKGQ